MNEHIELPSKEDLMGLMKKLSAVIVRIYFDSGLNLTCLMKDEHYNMWTTGEAVKTAVTFPVVKMAKYYLSKNNDTKKIYILKPVDVVDFKKFYGYLGERSIVDVQSRKIIGIESLDYEYFVEESSDYIIDNPYIIEDKFKQNGDF